jgi:hypothetical protein
MNGSLPNRNALLIIPTAGTPLSPPPGEECHPRISHHHPAPAYAPKPSKTEDESQEEPPRHTHTARHIQPGAGRLCESR